MPDNPSFVFSFYFGLPLVKSPWIAAKRLALTVMAACLSTAATVQAAQLQGEKEATAILMAGPWELHNHPRVFHPDGTFTSLGFNANGTWKIANGELDVTFKLPSIHRFLLPLNPAGTKGTDSKGHPEIMFRVGQETAPAPTEQPSASPAAGQGTPSPSASPAHAQTEQEAAALLTTGEWTVHKHPRIFSPDGTFSTPNFTSTGTWSIGHGQLTVVFPGSQNTYRFSLPLDPAGTNGVDGNGIPQVLTRAGTPSYGMVPPEIQQQADTLLQTYRQSIVLVTGSAGAGSGFVAALNGANYLFTNAHVAAELPDAAYEALDGNVLKGGALALAQGSDIFRVALTASGVQPLQIDPQVDADVEIGDWVAVLGNAGGGGVANTIIGKVTGIGPDRVEVDAPFIPGNSGSPIIQLKTGKVIGLATYLTFSPFDWGTMQMMNSLSIRRFGFRIDTVKAWQPVDHDKFESEAALISNIEQHTRDIEIGVQTLRPGMGQATGWISNEEITSHLSRWRAARAANTSPESVRAADASLVDFFKATSAADLKKAQGEITYDYFARQLAQEKQARDATETTLEQELRQLPILGGGGAPSE